MVRSASPQPSTGIQNRDQVVALMKQTDAAARLEQARYQVAMQPIQFDSQRVVWPQKVRIERGQQVTFKLDSGIRIIGPPGASPDFESQFLNDKKQTVQWGRQTWNTQVLLPRNVFASNPAPIRRMENCRRTCAGQRGRYRGRAYLGASTLAASERV